MADKLHRRFASCRLHLAAIAVAPILALAGSAAAQDAVLSAVPADYVAEYQAILANPGDLDRLYALARRAEAEAGRTGSVRLRRLAVRLYERMLLIDPGLSQVALRLGEIHFREGSYVEAGGYFAQALEDPAMPPDVREASQRYLDEIEDETAPSAFSGFVLGGLRHQSNATLGPDIELAFPPEEEDVDVFLDARIVHRYDPGWQSGHVFETTADLFANRHSEQRNFDTTALDLTFGPRFSLESYGVGGVSVRPYLLTDINGIAGELYSVDAGAGVSADFRVNPSLQASLDVRAMYRQLYEIEGTFDLNEGDGQDYRARFSAGYRLSPNVVLGAAFFVQDANAREAFNEFDRYGVELSGAVSHPGPGSLGAGDWTSTLTLGWGERDFDDFFGIPRDDDDRWSRLSTEIPVADNLSIVSGVNYSERDSTADDFDYDNWEVSLGVAYRF